MITAQDVLEGLEKNLAEIRDELGLDWSHFYQDLTPLRAGFTSVTDRNALEVAADPVWQVCLRYPLVKDLIHRRTTQRKLVSGGTSQKDDLPVREIVNRFQSLLSKLEEMERPKDDQNRQRKVTS